MWHFYHAKWQIVFSGNGVKEYKTDFQAVQTDRITGRQTDNRSGGVKVRKVQLCMICPRKLLGSDQFVKTPSTWIQDASGQPQVNMKACSVLQTYSSAPLQTVMPCAKGLKNVHGTSMNPTTRRGRQKNHLCGFVLGEISYDFRNIKDMTWVTIWNNIDEMAIRKEDRDIIYLKGCNQFLPESS